MDIDFKKTKYFNYLLVNHKEAEKDLLAFNTKILRLLNKETDELGRVLKCHLIIEHYIDNYLNVAYPTVYNWNNIRLTFSQKLELTQNPKTIFTYYSAIKNLNSIRNKFSHKLNYSIKSEDYKDIETIMRIWNTELNKSLQSGINLIEEFTIWICVNIDSMINGIKKQSKGLGIPYYLEWLKEMTK
jgi:hypothetical protein